MVVVLSDIHGCYNTLKELVSRVLAKYDVYKFIILGDLIDRGKYSLEVTDFVMELSKKYSTIILKGNHEDLLLDYLNKTNKLNIERWKAKDGITTLSSFSKGKLLDFIDVSRDDVYPYFVNYLSFFNSIKDYHTEKIGTTDFLFSHAGIADFTLPPHEQHLVSYEPKSPFVWSRKMRDIKNVYNNMVVVHGHVPVQNLISTNVNEPFVRLDKNGNIVSVDIDTACVYGGILSAMVIHADGKFNFEMVQCVD